MDEASEPVSLNPDETSRDRPGPPRNRAPGGEAGGGVLKALTPGVVDFLFRQLVAGQPAEDVQWGQEGPALALQPPGAELARRLAETDLDALTPTELFGYVRAAQRLAAWAESLRETAVGLYCSAPSASRQGLPVRPEAPPLSDTGAGPPDSPAWRESSPQRPETA